MLGVGVISIGEVFIYEMRWFEPLSPNLTAGFQYGPSYTGCSDERLESFLTNTAGQVWSSFEMEAGSLL